MSDIGTYENIGGQFVDVPVRMKRLRRDGANCPIPACAVLFDDGPRLDPQLIIDALLKCRCWICGGVLGGYKAFLLAPAETITRIAQLPPAHLGCVLFQANVVHQEVVTALYVTKEVTPILPQGFKVGEPEEVFWRFRSRDATADEIAEALAAVIPALRELAGEKGPQVVQALNELCDGLKEIAE